MKKVYFRNTLFASATLASLFLVVGSNYSVAAPSPYIYDPSEPIRSKYAPGELGALCDAAIANTASRLDAIAALPAEARTFENTILSFETANADFSDAVQPLILMDSVSPDGALSAEASDCEQKVGDFSVTINTRKDLYDAIKDMKPGNAEQARLLTMTLKAFESNGLKLPSATLDQIRQLKQKLAADQTKFSTNLNNFHSTITVAPDQVDGLPLDFLADFKRTDDGKYIIPVSETTYARVTNNAKNSEVRRLMLTAYQNRAADTNTALLEEAIGLRQQIAALMGYQTWADYQTDSRMAKNGATVLDFLNSLKDRLAQRNRDDLGKLLRYKQELDPTATAVTAWDINYLATEVQKKDYNLDQEKIREYLPATTVLPGMMDLYAKLFGVRFVRVQDGRAWAPGVQVFRIENPADGNLIAYAILDLYPRVGKYTHSAAFPLLSGRRMADGSYSTPVAAVVANVSPPSNGKPALFTHDDVQTIFHEFGHIMHMTLTRAPYASLSGSNVAQDFVEAPSQLMENWTFSPEIMNSISGFYADTSVKIPPEFIQQILAAKNFNQGYFYTRQIMLATLDMTYHTATGPVDTTAVMNRLYKDIIGIDPVEGGHFQAGFGHLMGGYDAGYYAYLWSEVYSADIFSEFEKAGLQSSDEGMRYRQTILEGGAMSDPMDLLKRFLGREPSQDGFLRKLGIGPS